MHPIPTFSTLSDTINAFVLVAMEDGDDHMFWSYCSAELHRLQDVHGKLAANATSLEARLCHRNLANACESLASAEGNDEVLEDLLAAAASALERAKQAEGQDQARLFAEFRFCIVAADLEYEEFGLTREVFLAYLEQCVQPG